MAVRMTVLTQVPAESSEPSPQNQRPHPELSGTRGAMGGAEPPPAPATFHAVPHSAQTARPEVPTTPRESPLGAGLTGSH